MDVWKNPEAETRFRECLQCSLFINCSSTKEKNVNVSSLHCYPQSLSVFQKQTYFNSNIDLVFFAKGTRPEPQ